MGREKEREHTTQTLGDLQSPQVSSKVLISTSVKKLSEAKERTTQKD